MKMKKFFIGVGKAALYFGAYFGGQMVVSFGISMVLAVVAMLSVMKPDGTYDMTAYMNRFNVMLNDWLYVIMVISGILTILTFWIVTLIRKKKFLKPVTKQINACNAIVCTPAAPIRSASAPSANTA